MTERPDAAKAGASPEDLQKLARLKNGEISPQALLSAEEFVQLMGGLEHAREVLATLEEIGDFTLADLIEAALESEYGDESDDEADFDEEFDDVADAA